MFCLKTCPLVCLFVDNSAKCGAVRGYLLCIFVEGAKVCRVFSLRIIA